MLVLEVLLWVNDDDKLLNFYERAPSSRILTLYKEKAFREGIRVETL